MSMPGYSHYREGKFKNADRRGGGRGTGLAIAKRILELHGGRMWVEDNPEGGILCEPH